jgi:hypothetical protein
MGGNSASPTPNLTGRSKASYLRCCPSSDGSTDRDRRECGIAIYLGKHLPSDYEVRDHPTHIISYFTETLASLPSGGHSPASVIVCV